MPIRISSRIQVWGVALYVIVTKNQGIDYILLKTLMCFNAEIKVNFIFKIFIFNYLQWKTIDQ